MDASGCPDDGACHHNCGAGYCFRVEYCEPLTAAGWGDRWPEPIRRIYGTPKTSAVLSVSMSETRDKPVTRYVYGCGWQVDGHFARHRCRECGCETEPGTVFAETGNLGSNESVPVCPRCRSFAVDLIVSYG